jgi:hypothetical protein
VADELLAKSQAYWDLTGYMLPLICAWLLFFVAIPAIIPSMVVDSNWQPVLHGSRQPAVDSSDTSTIAAHHRYFLIAAPAMLLVTVVTLFQARAAIRWILCL